jgi:Tol biopolymer transport system component
VPASVLAWLSWQLLEQDRALENQRIQERLEHAADLIAAALERRLSEAVAEVPEAAEDALAVTFTPRGVEARGLLYHPFVPPAQQPPRGVFEAGEALEFRQQDYAQAIAAFRELARSKDPLIRAGALVQMSQCYEKLGKTEARTAYEPVLREFAEQSEPARLARQRLAALERPGAAARPEMAIRRAWASQNLYPGRPSPDGRYLPYYDTGSGDLAIHDFTTGQSRRLYVKKGGWETNEEALDPVASPDGKQVAYCWHSNDDLYDLRVVGVDGSGVRVLYSNKEEVGYPRPHAWSPDGTRILAGLQKKDKTWQMVLVPVGDGSVRVLKGLGKARPSKMDFSPDGRYIAYDFPPREASQQRDIFTLAIEAGRETPLVQHAADDALMGWAPDGKSILFRSDRTGTRDTWLIEVSDGKPQGLPQLIKKDMGDIVPLGFTRAGAYYYEVSRTTREIYTATLDLGSGKVLSGLEPAARRFVGWNMAPDWSPDGRSLLIDERDNDGKWGLIQVDAQTGDVTPVLQFPYGDMPGFGYGRDGKTVFYTVFDARKQHHALTVRDLQTGRETIVVRRDVRYPALSPDGRWMAFSSYEADSLVLMVMPAGGGPPRELYRYKAYGPRGVAWTPEGRQLLFAFLRDRKGELWRIPVEGGQPQRLDVVVDGLLQFRLHPDGRHVAFEAWENKSEVWVMENFLPKN